MFAEPPVQHYKLSQRGKNIAMMRFGFSKSFCNFCSFSNPGRSRIHAHGSVTSL